MTDARGNIKDILNFIPAANRLLSITALVLTIYFFFVLRRPETAVDISGAGHMTPDAASSGAYPARDKFIPAFNENVFRRRQLFSVPEENKIKEQPPALIVRGISFGAKTIAVIRDTVKNRDYYCTQGDAIDDYKIIGILKDKVILESPRGMMEITIQ